MSGDEKNMKRLHELVCAMELDSKSLAKELFEKFGWGLSPRQIALYVGGVAKGDDLSDFVRCLEKLLEMRRTESRFLNATNMSDVVRGWKLKLRDCGVDDKVTNITLILESSGIPVCEFGAHLARDEKPSRELLIRMNEAIDSALALSARPTAKSLH